MTITQQDALRVARDSIEALLKANRTTHKRSAPETVMQAEAELDLIRNAVAKAEAALSVINAALSAPMDAPASAARDERMKEIHDAALNLLRQRGRYNTEIAYKRLEDAFRSPRNGKLPRGVQESAASAAQAPVPVAADEREAFDAYAADNIPQYFSGKPPTWGDVEANVKLEAWHAWKWRAALSAPAQQEAAQPSSAEPVAVIGSNFQLLYCRKDWSKGLKVGGLLYATPTAAAVQDAAQVRNNALEEAAVFAIQWGNARLDDHGGHALRNYADAIRALKSQPAQSADKEGSEE